MLETPLALKRRPLIGRRAAVALQDKRFFLRSASVAQSLPEHNDVPLSLSLSPPVCFVEFFVAISTLVRLIS